ncbi:MAG: MFS transporter [Bacillota bacterium]
MSADQVSKRAALLIAATGAFLTPFMGSSINVALPVIGAEFNINAILLSWVPAVFLLSAAMFLVPFGRLADIYGRKRIFTYGIMLFTFSSLLCGLVTSAAFLIVFRFLQGVGGAMMFGTGVAILTSVFPPKERGKALGINVAAVYMGLSVGPFLGGFLTQHLGWRSIFLTLVPLGLLVIGLVFTKLKAEWAEARGERFDFAGSVIYSFALVTLMYGFSLLPARSGAWLVLTGVIGIIGFVRWELQVRSPVLDVRLFLKNTVFAFSNLAALINYCATFAVGFLLSLYLQYIKGFSPQSAGLILVIQPVLMAVFSPFAGRLSDRIEPRVVASVGMALTTVGLFALTFLNEATSFALIVGSLVLLGLGFACFSSPNTNAVMSAVEKRFYGVASGTIGTMRLVGQMLSMGIAMLVFAVYVGRAPITPELYPDFLSGVRVAFAVFAVLCFAGIFASLVRGEIRPKPEAPAADGEN